MNLIYKFHSLIYGREIKVYSDHLPLVLVMKKDLHTIPNNRLKRIRIKFLLYDIDLEYLPGKYMYISHLLSRNFIKRNDREEDNMSDVIHTISEIQLNFKNNKESEFIEKTKNDEILTKVLTYCKEGWHKVCKSNGELKQYWKLRKEIMINNELLYYETRILVPKSLRKYVIHKLHATHLGISKTKARAKQLFYFPGINSQIENYIISRPVCLKFSKSKIKEPMLAHDIPDLPFYKIAMDIAELRGVNYLIVIDYCSRWIEIVELKDKTSDTIIDLLMDLFRKFGIPNEIVSDNMPFGSSRFSVFAKDWNLKLTKSSPYYAQSNGLAEKGVGIAKDMLKKSQYTGKSIFEYLLAYRNTPLTGLSYSPAQLLQSRELKSTIAINRENRLKPEVIKVHDKILENKKKQKQWYDRNAKRSEDTYVVDQPIYVQANPHFISSID